MFFAPSVYNGNNTPLFNGGPAKTAYSLHFPTCIVPGCGGVALGPKVGQQLGDRYFTAAPAQGRPYRPLSNVVSKADKR
jgi:hypothetical protein